MKLKKWKIEPHPSRWTPPLVKRIKLNGILFEVSGGFFGGVAIVEMFHPDDEDTPSFVSTVPWGQLDWFVVGYAYLKGGTL